MCLYEGILIILITVRIDLWKTICSEINIPFLLTFCLGYSFSSYILENFKTGVTFKRLTCKKAWKFLLRHRSKWFPCKQIWEACFRIICVKYYSDKFVPETILEICVLLLEEHVTT